MLTLFKWIMEGDFWWWWLWFCFYLWFTWFSFLLLSLSVFATFLTQAIVDVLFILAPHIKPPQKMYCKNIILFICPCVVCVGGERETRTGMISTKWRASPFCLKASMTWWALCTSPKPKKPGRPMKCCSASSRLLWEIRSETHSSSW